MDLIFLRDEEAARQWTSKDPEYMETFNLDQAVEFSTTYFVPLLEDFAPGA
jgi:hypothetical protein